MNTPLLSVENLEVAGDSDGPMRPLVRQVHEIESAGKLQFALRPKSGRSVVCGLEIVRKDLRPIDQAGLPVSPDSGEP